MFLQPQHFQQQQRHIEHWIQTRCSVLCPYPWGFSRLEIDEASMLLGRLVITRIIGVFPDGTPFDAPAVDPLPPAFEFPSEHKDKLVVLAISSKRPNTQDTSLGDQTDDTLSRYSAKSSSLRDASLPADKSAFIQTGDLKSQLMLESDATEAYQTLGFLRVIERRADNKLIVDKDYIPPSLDVSQTPRLLGFAREVQAMLHQRGDALAARLGKPGAGGVAEIADFLMLQSVNRYEPLFEHATRITGMHPERLFATCLEVCGDLAVFSSSTRRPKALPAYAHHNLNTCFVGVMLELRSLLSMVLDQRAIAIDLVDRKYGVRTASIPDLDLLRIANFVLAVNAQVPPDQLRARFPSQVKIGPVERIRDLVNLQLPGVNLRGLPVAPREIPFHSGFHYFELERSGDLWDQLSKTGNLAMHIAGDFPGIELEFWAIKQG
jgi:type VI secretion system protein ImpJ